jgi:lipopolysaccharide heptosyltransferase I
MRGERAGMERTYQRICLIKPSSLGDVIHSLPVLAALRSSNPDAFISWVVAPANASLLRGHPLLDEVLIFDRRAWGRLGRLPKTTVEVAGLVRALRRRRFELILDLQGLLRSALLAFASGSRERLGFANSRERAPLFYSRRIDIPEGPLHAVDRYMLAAEVVTGRRHPVTFPLGLTSKDHEEVERFLASVGLEPDRPLAVLCPGARWSSKRWPRERFAALAEELRSSFGLQPVILGGPGEEGIVEEVRRSMASPAPAAFFESLRTAACLFVRSEVSVTNDSGSMHLAAAAGCPVVAVFGPTDSRLTGPYGDVHQVVSHPVECSPCFLKDCPIGHDCMVEVPVEVVTSAVEGALAARAAEREIKS